MQLRNARTRKVWACRGSTQSEHQYLGDRSRSLHGPIQGQAHDDLECVGRIRFDLERDENDITNSKIRASIDAGTINTREPQRDAHLKSADFFHVENHPDLTFNSTSISKNPDGELKASGDLTIRGVTRNVDFDVEGPRPAQNDPWGNTRIRLSATTRISREDFGLTWNAALEAGGLLLGDAVTITLDVP